MQVAEHVQRVGCGVHRLGDEERAPLLHLGQDPFVLGVAAPVPLADQHPSGGQAIPGFASQRVRIGQGHPHVLIG